LLLDAWEYFKKTISTPEYQHREIVQVIFTRVPSLKSQLPANDTTVVETQEDDIEKIEQECQSMGPGTILQKLTEKAPSLANETEVFKESQQISDHNELTNLASSNIPLTETFPLDENSWRNSQDESYEVVIPSKNLFNP